MSFMDHLKELRTILVRSTMAILAGATLIFFVSDFVFDTIIFGPTDVNFITYRVFCEISHYVQIGDTICVTELPFVIQNTDIEGQVSLLIWTCVTVGFIIAFPYILWLFWGFISPALYEKERKNASYFIVTSSLLFFLGVLFGYFVIVPMSVNFFATFTVSSIIKNEFNADSYIGMIKTSVLACGLFLNFQLSFIS